MNCALKYICSAILLISLFADTAYAAVPIDHCQNLSSGDYYLVDNLHFDGNCLVIKGNGVTIDGNGYDIKTRYGSAIYNDDGYDNLVVRNLKIHITDGYRQGAIYARGMNGGLIEDVDIDTMGYYVYGIQLRSCIGIDILSNEIYTHSSSNGIQLHYSQGMHISGNSVITNSGYAVYVVPTTNCNYYNHVIDTTNTEDGRRVYYYYSPPTGTVFNGHTDAGLVYVACANGFTISNSVINGDGVYFANCQNSVLKDSTINTGSEWNVRGIEIFRGNTNSVLNNDINTYGAWSYGVYLTETTAATVKNNDIYTANSRSLFIDGPNSTSFSNNYYDHDISNNLADGKQLIYINGMNGGVIQNIDDVGEFYLTNSKHVTVRNVNVTKDGFYLAKVVHSTFEDCNMNTNQYGVFGFDLYFSDRNVFDGCNLYTDGSSSFIVYLYRSSNNEFVDNYLKSLGVSSIGFYLYQADRNTFHDNTVLTTNLDSSTIYIYDGERNDFHDNELTTYGSESYGIYLYDSAKNDFSGNDMYTADSYAVYINPTNMASYYDHDIDMTNTEQGMPIYYIHGVNNPSPLEDISNIGQLYVADSRGVTIDNVGVMKDGITFAMTTDSVIENSVIQTDHQSLVSGIYLQSETYSNEVFGCTIDVDGYLAHGIHVSGFSDYNDIHDNIMTVTGAGGDGFYVSESLGNEIYGNIISTLDVIGHGIHLLSSPDSVVYSNDVSCDGSNAFGIYVEDSDDGYFSNNALFTENLVGMSLSSSQNNNVSSFIFNPMCNYNYSISVGGNNNNFTYDSIINITNINFDDNLSWFNYREDVVPNVTLSMNVSEDVSIFRQVSIWDVHFFKWNDTPTNDVLVVYTFTGLTDEEYTLVVTEADGSRTVTEYMTPPGGVVSFQYELKSNTEFMLLGDFDPPIVYVDVYPDPVSSLGTVHFDVTCIDAGGGCRSTLITAGPYSCSVDHKDGLPDTCRINLEDKCKAGTYYYYVDTVDDYGFHNTSVNGSFQYKKDDGCDCMMNEECLGGSCLHNYVCLSQLGPEISFASNLTAYDLILGHEDVILIKVVNPLNFYNSVELTLYGDPVVINAWMGFEGDYGSYEKKRTVRVEPNSEVYVPIYVFGGKVGTYELSVFGMSQINGLDSSSRQVVNVVAMDGDSLYRDTPGLDGFGIVFVVAIGALLFLNKSR